MTASSKIWRLAPNDPTAAARLAREARLSETVARLLINRGVTEANTARRFLDGPLSDLHAPGLLPNLAAAAERLLNAIRERKSIWIYGDYDADGVTGTSILVNLCRVLGNSAKYYIPNRLQEGYGLNKAALDEMQADGAQLVITVDCGITAIQEADHANQIGLDLIITDHHEMKERLPPAREVVHPRLPGSPYPFAGLCGAGVAFKLAWAVAMQASGSERVTPDLREYLLDATGLAALGLVADVMPLHDENRILVRKGLERIISKPSIGLAALIETSGLKQAKTIQAEDVAYKLAPRLNAAGRLGCARLVVELLTTQNAARAQEIAEYLNGQNTQRQSIERKIGYQARERIAAHHLDAGRSLVLESSEWHAGVIGIVAGRLCEQYARPTILIACGQGLDPASGSGRSPMGCPLHELLESCSDLLISHGGHAAAAGLKIEPAKVPAFRDRFEKVVAERFPNGLPPAILSLESELPIASLTIGLLKEIHKLEPYGFGNPRPRFLASDLTVSEPKKIGQGDRHLSFRVQQNGTSMRAVAFGKGDELDRLMSQNGKCCLAFTPKVNTFNGWQKIELEVIDFIPGPNPMLG